MPERQKTTPVPQKKREQGSLPSSFPVIFGSCIVAILAIGFYFGQDLVTKTSPEIKNTGPKERLFTVTELASFDGSDSKKPIYLSILGHVFDVSLGRKHYGPGGGYHGFSGKDASRSFVTGDFTESGLAEGINDLEVEQFGTIQHWIEFYTNHKEYFPCWQIDRNLFQC
eukprot:TRINITY_DN2021_c0_g1_i2.p1 TRINITY_DN2021_c0_g1~~TRINITY_DN2021_c0_g1_i2.p1  ORF type:complete len:169 (+),score=31.59 TRINITY_DN2021_c0_g1_i2:98-604(+)